MKNNNMPLRRSIKSRIAAITILSLAVLAIVMGVVSTVSVSEISTRDTDTMMSEICQRETLKFKNKLDQVSQSVGYIYTFTSELNESKLGNMQMFSDNYTDSIRNFAVSVAENTEGAMAVYYRYNPDLTGSGTSGFFWSKKDENAKFEEEVPTDILAYDADDVEHVGWYTEAKESGQAIWMSPYYNQNLDVFMISYIVPVYKDNTFVGVIGIDIDFDKVMNVTKGVELYDSGYVGLVDVLNNCIYTQGEDGKALKNELNSKLRLLAADEEKEGTVNIICDKNNENAKSSVCCLKLENGMHFVVSVPLSEVNKSRNKLMIICILIALIVLLDTALVILNHTDKIVRPLMELSKVADQYANGNWDERYHCETGDEIQHLSESVATMADMTKSYIDEINSYARRDAITGIRNKMSYLEHVDNLKANYEGRYDRYGLVVFDLNYLKKANDTFGHEAGDALIIAAANCIAESFLGCKAFRIGGDEFAVIVKARKLDKLEELLADFKENMSKVIVAEADNMQLSIAYGYALKPEDGEDFDDVFNAADGRMYEQKKAMKAGR